MTMSAQATLLAMLHLAEQKDGENDSDIDAAIAMLAEDDEESDSEGGGETTELATGFQEDDDYAAITADYVEWLGMLEAADQPVEDEHQRILAELEDTPWSIAKHGGKWQAEHEGEVVEFELSLHGYTLAAERSPKGGITISGKFYKGGQWIPGSVVADASPQEKAKLDAAKAEGETRKAEKNASRIARGSVSLDKLRERTAPYADDLRRDAEKNAKRSFGALHRHHGKLALHRIEELIEQAEKALESLGEDQQESGVALYFRAQLAKFGRLLDFAEEAGLTGKIEEPEDDDGKQEETTPEAGEEPAVEPDVGAIDGPDPSGIDEPEPERRIREVVTARPHLTKPGDPGLVAERLREHLREHQVQAAAKGVEALDTHGGFFLADGAGTGKTRSILAIAQTYADRGKKVVIVAPAAVVKPNWAQGTVAGSFDHDSQAMGVEWALTRGTEPIDPGKVHISTYDNLGKLKEHIDDDTVVLFDESHLLKNQTSARSKHGWEIAQKAGGVMYSTATPADSPLHILHLFRAGVLGAQDKKTLFKELGVKGGEVDPKVGAPEVYRRLSGFFDKLTEEGLMLKREVSLEGLDIGHEHVEISDEDKAKLEKIAEDSPKANRGMMLMHQRRQQEPFKVPHAVERAKKDLADGKQVVIFASRVNASEAGSISSEATSDLLREALAREGITDVVELHGESSINPKKAMAAFQNGEVRVIITTAESGGTGVNLDDDTGTAPRSMIIMTPPFSAVDNVQMIGRVHRLKTQSDSNIHYLFGDTAVDQWNRELISGKMAALGAVVAGEAKKLDIPSDKPAGDEKEGKDTPDPEPFAWERRLKGEGSKLKPKPALNRVRKQRTVPLMRND